jgi:hypothetical protein
MALCLNGCVAAAIPAIAGAAMARKELQEEEVNPEAAPQVQVTPAPDLPPAAPEPAPMPMPMPMPVLDTPVEATQDTPYSLLITYVLREKATQRDARSPRYSAILTNPSKLDGKRRTCTSDNLAVLVDLDPYKASMAPEIAPEVPASLTKGLQSLRDNNVVIAWISQGTAAQAGDIRGALKRTGLDPESRDRLILMRYRGDRKQTRRDDLAKEMCLIAIAGDHRADFDELYDYLVKPEAAQLLEPIIGNGWFVVPPVLGRR